MEVLYERCCGIDVHKKSSSACLMTPGAQRKPIKEPRKFGTTTPDLLELVDWLVAARCTHVAMESTGPHWKPLYNLLEGVLEVLVVNAQHIKVVPGRKTNVRDAEWIANLLRHGLLRGSFIPSKPMRELWELVRYRRSLIEERAAEINRVQKVLEGANIKLSSVATDITGVSGRAILECLVDGRADPSTMAELAKGRMRKKIPELQKALTGRMEAHQRLLLSVQLTHLDHLDEAIAECSQEIERRMESDVELIQRLCTIPGVGQRTAESILAEIGQDMDRFPTHKHLASWAGICPGNHRAPENAPREKRGKGIRHCGRHWSRLPE